MLPTGREVQSELFGNLYVIARRQQFLVMKLTTQKL